MLCLITVHSEHGKFGPRIEDHHNDPISVQVLFTPIRPWHVTTGFWETAPHGRQGHRYWLFLSTGMSSVGHRKEQLWAENRWSLLPLQKLTKGRIKCAHRIEQAAGCLWPLTSLPFRNRLARSFFPWITLRQAIITSLQDLCKSIPAPCCSACHLGLWKAWSGFLYLCSPFFVPMEPPVCTAELYFLALPPLCRPGREVKSAAAAAAKSIQSCLTLCDLIDGSPPGSPVPGILQARIRASLLPIIPENYKNPAILPLSFAAWPLINSLFRKVRFLKNENNRKSVIFWRWSESCSVVSDSLQPHGL